MRLETRDLRLEIWKKRDDDDDDEKWEVEVRGGETRNETLSRQKTRDLSEL